jgi:hypothetical protein
MRHGCFAGPDHSAGRNDLRGFGVSVTGAPNPIPRDNSHPAPLRLPA